MAGYSGTPLVKKLGIKPGYVIAVFNEPKLYREWLGELPTDVKINLKGKELDFIHWFVEDKKIYEKEFLAKKATLKKDGMIWVSWPKKSSKVVTDLDENVIRDYALEKGLVDVKVCAVSDVWSGLKLVYRLAGRK